MRLLRVQIQSQDKANHHVRKRFFQDRLHPNAQCCAQVPEPLVELEIVAAHLVLIPTSAATASHTRSGGLKLCR
jgi:hypothetical protein